MADSKGMKIIAAIDIGTSYSRCAYTLVSDGAQTSAQNAFTWKTKTSILLKKDGKFVAYGDEAEDQYIRNGDKDDGPVLFRGFKKDLYNNPTITRNTYIRDISGKHEVPALKLFTLSLWYLKNHMMRTINTAKGTYCSEDEILFMLTVPSVWNNKAKAVMRLAATKADIKPDKMCIVLDSECASLFHQSMDSGGVRQKGTKYVLVDFGGGTVDIAAHMSAGDGSVESLLSPSGGNWGGSNIEECFRSYLQLIFGQQAMEEFIKKHSSEFLQLFNDLDNKMTNLTKNPKLTVPIPLSLLNIACQKMNFQNIENMRKHINSYKVFQMKDNELIVESQSLKGMYEYSVNCLSEELNSLFKKEKVKNVTDIIMVGGLSKSKNVQDTLRKMLGGKKVIFPNCDFDVAKGAILLGYNPDLITSRVIRLTYGIKKTVPYDDAKHKGGETATVGGVKMCTNVFHVLVKGETLVKASGIIQEVDKPLLPELKEQLFEIYTSGKCGDIPKFTSDPTVNKEADFTVPLPFGCLVNDKIFDFHSSFGKPEVKFSVTFKKYPGDTHCCYLTLK